MSTKIDLSLDIASTSTKDAKQWVQKSRTSQTNQPRIVPNDDENNNDEELHSQHASKKRKLASSNSNNYAGNDLKGLQVMHGMKDFEQGHEVILTLADTNILATDEHGKVIGISEGDDMLENVNFAERERIHDREKQLKKLRQGSHYSGYDDAEFEEGFHPGMKPSMLSKYDKEKRKTAKLILLGENEVSSHLSPEERELQENQKNNPLLQRKYQSLQNDLRQGSSYLTQEEIKFKKSSKDRKNKAKTRQKQPTTAEEETAGGGNEDYDLRNILGDGGNSTTNDNNDNNMDLSANESKISSSAVSAPKQPKMKFDSFVFEDEDPDLSLALAKARQLALQKRQQEEKKQKKSSKQKMETDEQQDEEEEQEDSENDLDRGAKVAREFSLKALEREKKESENKLTMMIADDERTEGKQQFGGAENEGATLEELLDVDSEGRRADGKLIFNSTTEFTTRLQARLNENARSRAEAAMKDMERSSSTRGGALDSGMGGSAAENEHHRLPTPKKHKVSKPAEGERMEEDNEEKENEAGEDEEGEEQEGEGENDWAEMEDESEEMSVTSSQRHQGEYEEDPLGFPNTQPVLSKGLGATLDLLRATGELKKTNRLAGRAKDDRANDPSNEDRGITIEYRDEFGRKLTQKEAFRQLSYKFHGYGPGKKKSDKRLQQVKEERKVVKKRSKVLEGDAGTLKNLTKTQEATGKAHLVIQGGTSSVPSSVISKMASTMAKKK
jgi:U4/U6.U5 tri-snRNP-associated protein 1